MVYKVITNLDLSKASGPDHITVVVLNHCEPELLYIVGELFNKCLKGWYFPVLEIVGERSAAKNCHPVSPLSAVNKVFEKLVNNRFVDHYRNVIFSLIFSMILGLLNQLQILWQFYLTEFPGLLTGLRLAKRWHLIYPSLLTGCGMLVFFTILSHGISAKIFGLISSVLSNRQSNFISVYICV